MAVKWLQGLRAVLAGLPDAVCAPLFGYRVPRGQRQLLVDISVISLSDSGSGIQRVVRALIAHLDAQMPSGVLLVPVTARRHRSYRITAVPGRSSLQMGRRIRPQSGDIFLGLDLAAHLLPLHERQLTRWKSHGVTVALVVYDLLPVLRPDWFTTRMVRMFSEWLHLLARQADHALCISNDVRQTLAEWLQANGTALSNVRLDTICLGADIRSSMPSRGLPQGFRDMSEKLPRGATILMVGTIEPRKGYEEVLAAFNSIWTDAASSVTLIIVGRPGWKTDNIQATLRHHPENGHRLFWLDNTSDEALERLYERCDGVLLASHAEGYGLPLVEAAWHGRKLLVRDIPVFREIGGTGVSYFKNAAPDVLARDILDWLADGDAPVLAVESLPDWQQAASDVLAALGLLPESYP